MVKRPEDVVHGPAFSLIVEQLKTLSKIALDSLNRDIADPEKNVPRATNYNEFMLKASSIGAQLMRAGAYSSAERLYCDLLTITLDYRQRHGVPRHAGALYANLATAYWLQGNIDLAVIQLLKAAQEDVQTAGVQQQASYAVVGLYQKYVAEDGYKVILTEIMKFDPSLTIDAVKSFCKTMYEREYALHAYVHLAKTHMSAIQESGSVYSRLQLFSALRNLAVLLEVEFKASSGILSGKLDEVIVQRYGTEPGKRVWWQKYAATCSRLNNKAKGLSDDQKIRRALAIKTTPGSSAFWKGMLISYLTRYYTSHHLETQTSVISEHPGDILSAILHTLVTASNY